MVNETWWLVLLVVNFGGVLLAFRLFGGVGLYVWVALAGIVANIQVTMTIEIVGLTATLGNIVYGGSFLATDILNERYGPEAAKRAVGIGFFSILSATVLMNLALLFSPAEGDIAYDSLATVFGLLPRIAAASLLAYFISQRHDVWAYDFWRRRVPGPLWLRNNLSTIVSQLIDSVVFVVAAFVGMFPPGVLIEIAVTTYLIKVIVALLDTPVIYLAMRIRAGWQTPGDEVNARQAQRAE